MKHLFVSYEIAKALRELGFDEPCFGWFTDNYLRISGVVEKKHVQGEDETLAPIHQQVIDWFREKQGIEINVFSIIPFAYAFSFEFMSSWKENANNPIGVDIVNNVLAGIKLGHKHKTTDEWKALKFDYYTALNAAIDEAIKLIQKQTS